MKKSSRILSALIVLMMVISVFGAITVHAEEPLTVISAEQISNTQIKITFSEPVETNVRNPFVGIRYCNEGTNDLAWHKYKKQNAETKLFDVDAQDPLQVACSLKLDGTNVGIVNVNGLDEILSGNNYGEKYKNCEIRLCFEGLPIEGIEKGEVGFVDNIKAVSGDKYLQATEGKFDKTNGNYDGFYCPVTKAEEQLTVHVAAPEELADALTKNKGALIVLDNDIVWNEMTTEYDAANGVIIVKDFDGEEIAKVGTGENGTTIGEVISGSLESLNKWNPLANLNFNKLDGNGHSIKGLYLSNKGTAFVDTLQFGERIDNLTFDGALVIGAGELIAVVCRTQDGDITNLHVKNAAVLNTASGNYHKTAMISGRTRSTSIIQNEQHCPLIADSTADGVVIVSSTADTNWTTVGGFVAQSIGGKIINCVNYADVKTLSGKTYGLGGFVGLFEASFGGPLNAADNPYFSKKIANAYIYNCANYGNMTASDKFAGGIAGYVDLCWSTGNDVVIENVFSEGTVTNGGALIGRAQDCNPNGTFKKIGFSFAFADSDNLGAASAVLAGNSIMFKKASMADALKLLNGNAGNIDGAYGWKEVDGKIIPDKATAPDDPPIDQDTITNELKAVPDYDPAKEVALLAAEIISDDTIKLTFSEPVMAVGNVFAGVRFCTVSDTGVPGLKNYKNESGGTTYLQLITNNQVVYSTKENVAYVRYAPGGLLDKVKAKELWGDQINRTAMTFCFEGLAAADKIPSPVKGYVDNIQSLDGTKLLKATPGKSAGGTDTIYDGAYVELTQAEEPFEVITAVSAELAGTNTIRVKFSAPIKLVGKVWVSVRYCNEAGNIQYTSENYDKDGESEKTIGKVPMQFGSNNFVIDPEDPTCAIWTFGDNGNAMGHTLFEAIEGTAWGTEGDGLYPYFYIEGLANEAIPTPLVGYLDNLRGVDGGYVKSHNASAATGKDAGVYDGIKFLITPHEHAPAEEWSFDGETHWHACTLEGCDYKFDEAAHSFEGGEPCECGKEAFTLGDIDGNETVDADDAIYLLYYTFFPEEYPINQSVDFDGSGSVDADDAIYLLYYTFFPEEYPLTHEPA